MVGHSGSAETAVDLLKRDGRAAQGVAGLRVSLTDGKLLLRAILNSDKAHTRGLHGDVDGIDHGIARGRFGLNEGILHGRLQLCPADDALAVCDTGAGGTVSTVQGKGSSGKGLAAAAHLGDLQRAQLRLLAAPFEDGVGSLRSLGGVGDDIRLLVDDIVVREINLILHHIGAAADGDLALIWRGIHGDAELGSTGILIAVIVQACVVIPGGQRPCGGIPEGSAGQLVVLCIYKHSPARRAVCPQLNRVIRVVGGGGGGKDVLAGIVCRAADDLALDAVLLLIRGKLQRHVAGDGDVAAEGVFLQTDIHTCLIDFMPQTCGMKDQLNGMEYPHLLLVADRFHNGFTAGRKLCS